MMTNAIINAVAGIAQTKLNREDCAFGMGQNGQKNDAATKSAAIFLSGEECASSMGQRSNENCAASKGAQIKFRREESARSMDLGANRKGRNAPLYIADRRLYATAKRLLQAS